MIENARGALWFRTGGLAAIAILIVVMIPIGFFGLAGIRAEPGNVENMWRNLAQMSALGVGVCLSLAIVFVAKTLGAIRRDRRDPQRKTLEQTLLYALLGGFFIGSPIWMSLPM